MTNAIIDDKFNILNNDLLRREEVNRMKYFELLITFVIKQDIHFSQAHEFLSKVISKAMLFNEELKVKHMQREIKNYVFGLPYPVNKDLKIYQANHAFVFNIRSFDESFLLTMKEILSAYDCGIKVLMSQVVQCRYSFIEFLDTLTPVVVTIDGRCWTHEDGMALLQQKLHNNTARKTKMVFPGFIEPELNFICGMELISRKMISIPYKNTKLLGTKLRLYINSDETSQKMAFTVMGAGIAEKGSLGMGFCASRK